MIVKRFGCEAVTAANGSEGVEKAFATGPDLILMDLGLPEMTGDQATARLKANPATQSTPVVIQTAYGGLPIAKRALEAGAAEILQKPISIAEIQQVLRKYLPGADKTLGPDVASSPPPGLRPARQASFN